MTDYSVQEISEMAASHVEEIARELFPAGKRVGNEWRVGSVNGEPGKSLGIHLEGEKRGIWCDFATGQSGDMIDLIQARRGCTKGEAVAWAKDFLGLEGSRRHNGTTLPQPSKPATNPDDDWQPITPIPKDAGRAREHELGKPSAHWAYRDADGNILMWACRWDTTEGKEIRPLTYWRRPDGHQGWEWKHLPAPRPLYGLDRLNQMPGATVHIVEGEKGCDAAHALFPEEPCITWPGGTNAADKADWRPVADRSVLVWPDNDEPGRKAAEAVAQACLAAGAREVRVVQIPPGFPNKWDLADPLPPDLPLDMLDRMRADAKPNGNEPDRTSRDTAASNPTRRQLRAVNIDAFLQLEIPPREMVLAPIIPSQGLAMLYAQRGVGKTYLGIGVAYAVATGGKFLRWSAPEPRRVLYIDGEMPASDMKRRIAEVVEGADKELPSSDYFHLITPDIQDEGIPDLSTDAGQEAIEDHLDGVSLVVVDNLSTLCRYGRENEAESWEPMQQWLLSLRRRGMSVLIIHHAGKGGAQRGTSKREDALDTVLCLSRPDDYQSEEGARFEIHFEKARGIVGDDAKAFEARMETRDDAATWTMRDIEDREMEQVRALTAAGLSARDIATETEMSKSKVNRLQNRIRVEADATAQYADEARR